MSFALSLVSTTLSAGYTLAFLGYLCAGSLLEMLGRRFTVCAYFMIGSLSSVVCFLSHSDSVITVAYILVIAMQALWGIAATITSEIFPTGMRGTANAVVNNLLGRTGMVIAPGVVGFLSGVFGSVGLAVATIAIIPLCCIPLIIRALDETRGRPLEEIA